MSRSPDRRSNHPRSDGSRGAYALAELAPQRWIIRLILEEEGWADLAAKGFDHPRQFAAFLHTLRWNCVTATDPNLFQAPFRAGIPLPPAEYQGSIYENQRASGRRYFATPDEAPRLAAE